MKKTHRFFIAENSIKWLMNCALISSTTYALAAEKTRPNIVVIIADDISMDDFGCYGHPVIKTPNIDALAKNGVRFTNTYLTASSSSPSRASIITGRYPHNTGACELHSAFGAEQITIAELLKKSGYYTAQAGKWHFGIAAGNPQGPAMRGFDRTGGSKLDGGGESGSEKFVTYLKERPGDKPFFMWLAPHDAHREWDDDQSLKRYDPKDVDVLPFYLDNKETRDDLASYYYEVTRFDYYVGKVVEELKAQGVFNNTFIVVMADNGRPFPRAKTRLIPDGIKTPFIVHYPAAVKKTGVACNSLMSVIDLAPTLSEIAGIPVSRTFQGKSFLSLLGDTKQKFRNYIFAEHNWHDYEALERMVCNGKFLLIENKRPKLSALGAADVMRGASGRSLFNAQSKELTEMQKDIFVSPRPAYELYDLSKDKFQTHNLAKTKSHILNKMLKTLRKWQSETGDSYPEDITPDWYTRTDIVKKNSNFDIRKEMPGTVNDAKNCIKSGPF